MRLTDSALHMQPAADSSIVACAALPSPATESYLRTLQVVMRYASVMAAEKVVALHSSIGRLHATMLRNFA